MLTPDYGLGCKRRIFDQTWFPSLSNPKIELTNERLIRLTKNGIVIGTEIQLELPVDIIVLANGFHTTTWLHRLDVIGREGVSLHNTWDERGGPQAYMGTAMDGFPNFFIIHGPNVTTGHSSVILQSENMVDYSIKFISKVLGGEVEIAEVKKSAEVAYTREIRTLDPPPPTTCQQISARANEKCRISTEEHGVGERRLP